MRLVLGFLAIWWPAMLGVALASLATASPDRRVLRGTDRFWVALPGSAPA